MRLGPIILLLAAAGASPPRAARPPEYTLTFSAAAPRRIGVVARLPVGDDTLRMSSVMSSQLPAGYATFVHDLAAFDGARRIPLRPVAGGDWVIAGPRPAEITLTYNVVVAHDSVQWNLSGAFARGYAVDTAVMFAGRSVFIASTTTESTPIRVHVVLPRGWSFATSYPTVPGDPNTFEAATIGDLWANANLAGRLARERLAAGDLTVSVAGSESMKDGLAFLSRAVGPVLATYGKMMHGAPAGALAVMVNASPAVGGGGEAFRQSISMVLAAPPTDRNRSGWEYLVAHELFHKWDPQALPPVDQSQFEWMVEGFTDYMTRLGLLRAGAASRQQFLEEIGRSYARYLSVAGRVSLRDAGADKGGNFTLIYSGGMSLAAALDAEMRARTNGADGVPQLMARLYADYGRTHRAYDLPMLARVASELAGSDMSSLLTRYATTTEVLPLDRYMAKVGVMLHRDGRIAVAAAPAGTGREARLLTALLER